jgi:hypothetical protein
MWYTTLDKTVALDLAIAAVKITFGKSKAYLVLKSIRRDYMDKLVKERREECDRSSTHTS